MKNVLAWVCALLLALLPCFGLAEESAEKSMEEIVAELQALVEDNAAKAAEIEALTAENEQLKEEIGQLQAELEALSGQIFNREALQSKWEEKKEDAQQAMDALGEKIDDLSGSVESGLTAFGAWLGEGLGEAGDFFSSLFSEQEEAPEAEENTVRIEIEVQDYGVIRAELYPDVAPITVANFVKLAQAGFYDGLTFHRIISGFMIQGGDPNGNGTGGSAEKIKGEFAANGVENSLSHERGVLSMARARDNDSASSQFFIMHADAPYLDGQYAAFGRVTEGIEVVDAICEKTPVQDGNGTVAKENQPVIVAVRVVE